MDVTIKAALIQSVATLVVGIPTFIALVIAIRQLQETAKQSRIAVYQKTIDTEHDLFRMIAKNSAFLRLCYGRNLDIPSTPTS